MSDHDRAHRRGASVRAHDHLSGRYIHLHAGSPNSAAVRGNHCGEAERPDSGAPAIHQHESDRRHVGRAPDGHEAGGFSRAGLRHRELLAKSAGRVQQGADPSSHRADALHRAGERGDPVPRSDPELAACRPGRRRANAARGVPLAASGMRGRNVSVRHSLFGSDACEGSESLALHALRPPAGCGDRHRLATTGEDSADRSRRHRRDSAHGAQLRIDARPARAASRASAVATALAAVDSKFPANHGGARSVYCR